MALWRAGAARTPPKGTAPAAGAAAGNSQVRDRGGRTGRADRGAARRTESRARERAEAHPALRPASRAGRAAWCRSPAGRCPCSTRPASWPSTSTAAPPPPCSTSPTWARSGSTAPDAADALERLVPGDIVGLAPGRARYTVLTDDDGGILDDLIVSNAGDHLFVVVNAGCRDADLAHLRAALEPGHARSPSSPTGRCWPCRGPRPRRCWPAWRPAAPGCAFMATAEMDVGGLRLPRLAPGLHRRGRLRDLGRRPADAEPLARAPAGRCRGGAGRPGCPQFAAPGGGPAALRPRHRRRRPRPVEAGLGWTIGKRRRERGRLSRCRAHPAPARATAPARKLVGLKPEGRAPGPRGHRDPATGRPARSARSPAAASARPSAGRSPWAMSRPPLAAPGHRGRARSSAASRCRRTVAALPFVPHRYHR